MNVFKPVQKFANVTSAGTSLDWGVLMGACTIYSLGTGDLWFKFDGNPGAADAAGQYRLKARDSYQIGNTGFRMIGFITAGADTATVEVSATINKQSS